MLLGISGSGYFHDCSVAEGMKQIRDAGYDSVDFNLYDFCQPGGPMLARDWQIWIDTVRQATLAAGLVVGQVHALFGFFTAPDLAYEAPPEIFFKNIEACARLECMELVFHPVFRRAIVDTEELRAELIAYNARWFRELLIPAKNAGVHIDLENTFDRRAQPYAPPFSTAADLLELAAAIGDDTVGICLDTGHAHIMSCDIVAMIRSFGDKLRALHLNDNLGSIESCPNQPGLSDQHFFPGTGSIDFLKVFCALKEIDYTGIINLEPGDFLARLPVGARNASIAGGALVTRAIAREAGYE